MKINHSIHSHALPVIGTICFCFLTYGIFAYHSIAADSDLSVSKVTSGSTASAVSNALAAAGDISSPAAVPSTGITASAGDANTAITDPKVAARIGSADVKVEDLRKTLASLTPEEQAAIANDPVVLMKVVRTILIEEVVLKEIANKQWGKQPEVQAHLERVRETALTDMYLRSVSKPPDGFPGDAELHKVYEANKAAYSVPHQFKMLQIFVAVPINAEKAVADKAQAKLEGILHKIHQPEANFAEIAKNESDDKLSGALGGDMGWLVDSKMPPRIRAQALVLPRGMVSEPVRLNDGWHILKMMDSKDFSITPFDEIKGTLARQLQIDNERTNRMAYLGKLLGEYPVTINDQAVSNILNKVEK